MDEEDEALWWVQYVAALVITLFVSGLMFVHDKYCSMKIGAIVFIISILTLASTSIARQCADENGMNDKNKSYINTMLGTNIMIIICLCVMTGLKIKNG